MSKLSPASRRQFLKTLLACSTTGASGLAMNLASFNAFASDTSGYKALVCVFLYGGLDNMDTIIPTDNVSYNQWASIRSGLVSQHGGGRNRNALLALDNSTMGATRTFGMAPELAPLYELYQNGVAGVVGNVGPLIEPLNRDEFINETKLSPKRLFSHNDQQSTWMASRTEGASAGWGGRLADMVAQANDNASFTAISPTGTAVFLSGDSVRPFAVSGNGAARLNAGRGGRVLGRGGASISALAQEHATSLSPEISSLFARDLIDVQARSIVDNNQLSAVLEEANPALPPMPENNRLARQLEIVARIISERSALGARRQVFFVSTGGFDTHSNQAERLPELLGGVSAAIRYFYDATVQLGVANSVTTFTASDFGRTINQNDDGTDHGWGGEHFVVGGAVNGGRVHGFIPLIERTGPYDSRRGDRGGGGVIPTTSVEQYAAALGGWFGLNNSELNEALPNLPNFDPATLNNLFL